MIRNRTRFLTFLLAIVAVVFFTATPTSAMPPAKTELAIGGSYFKAKDAEAVWDVAGRIAGPLNSTGSILLGPKFLLGSDDFRTAAGAVLHWNFLGSSRTSPYIGGDVLYNLKDVDGVVRYSGNVGGGIKVQLAPGCTKACGGVDLNLSRTQWGRGKDGARPAGTLLVFARF